MSSRGIARASYVSSAGEVIVQGEDVGYWDFIYSVSAVKAREWNVGDRVVLPDGRVFRYGFSSGACWAGRGVKFTEDIATYGLDWVLAASNQAVGDREITLTNATLAWTIDELRGGYLLVCHGTDDEPQNRMIVGNSAVAAGTNVVVYLDGPLNRAIVSGTTRILAHPCPYRRLQHQSHVCESHAGVPAAYVSAANRYFWVQTWGPLWVALQGNPGRNNDERQLVFRRDGSLGRHDPADALEQYQQHAGFIIDHTSAGVTGTWVMLQVSP